VIQVWRAIQRQNFKDWKTLFQFLELEETLSSSIIPSPDFPLNLPVRLAKKIAKKKLNDPILRQFLPLKEELISDKRFLLDPLEEQQFCKSKKLLQKYEGRALIVTTSACAMHCRFCFRKNFPYETENPSFENELQILEEDSSITEVLLSGGDPLSLSNSTLEQLIGRLSRISHLKRLRFHTRFPIGIPERIDTEFLHLLSHTTLQSIFVVHCNHPLELDQEVIMALKNVQKLGIPILTHTVLLKGVNDELNVLKKLFETLADNGFIPYCLNQLDTVAGTSHFEVDPAVGRSLIKQLRAHLPGYAVPRYVQEIPNRSSKTNIENSE